MHPAQNVARDQIGRTFVDVGGANIIERDERELRREAERPAIHVDLVEEREARLSALRATLEASIAAGGEVSDAELDEALDECDAALAREGMGA